MKKKVIFSLVCYTLGLTVGFVLLFPFSGKAQFSYAGGMFGLGISVASLIYGSIIMNAGRNKRGYNTITGKMTPMQKFYLPIFSNISFQYSTAGVYAIPGGHKRAIYRTRSNVHHMGLIDHPSFKTLRGLCNGGRNNSQ